MFLNIFEHIFVKEDGNKNFLVNREDILYPAVRI